MEKRTKIIISIIAIFVIGLPLLFFILLAQGFGSSAGDYYKLSGLQLSLISQKKTVDSTGGSWFSVADKLDTTLNQALYIYLNTHFYSQSINTGSSLMAAHEPGLKGCKEKISGFSCVITNLKTKEEKDVSSMLYMPDNLQSWSDMSYNNLFKSAKICLYALPCQGVMLFESADDFKNKFNANSSRLSHLGLGDRAILFYLKKEAFSNLQSGFKITVSINFSDGSVISSFATHSM